MDPFPISLQHLQDFCFISVYTKLGCKYLSETSTFSRTSSNILLIVIVRKSLKKVTLFFKSELEGKKLLQCSLFLEYRNLFTILRKGNLKRWHIPVILKCTQTFSGSFCCWFPTRASCGCSDSLPFVCGRTAADGLVEDFGAVFLYMDVGFFPVPKKAAPTNIFGLGFRLLNVMVIAFLDSVGLLLAGATVGGWGGLVATLLN